MPYIRRSTLTNALYVARDRYLDDARTSFECGASQLKEIFERQAKEVNQLAELIEEHDTINLED